MAIVTGQIIFQIPFVWNRSTFEIIRHQYNMLLISLMDSILLWPIIAINEFQNNPTSEAVGNANKL